MTTPRTIAWDDIRVGQHLGIKWEKTGYAWHGRVWQKSDTEVVLEDGSRFDHRIVDRTFTLLDDAPTTDLPKTAMDMAFIPDGKGGVTKLSAPRPEHVVKAEALREAVQEMPDLSGIGSVVWWLRARADELDPSAPAQPAEPAGQGAVVRDRDGVTWVRVGPQWRSTEGGHFGPWLYIATLGPLSVLSDGWTGDIDA